MRCAPFRGLNLNFYNWGFCLFFGGENLETLHARCGHALHTAPSNLQIFGAKAAAADVAYLRGGDHIYGSMVRSFPSSFDWPEPAALSFLHRRMHVLIPMISKRGVASIINFARR